MKLAYMFAVPMAEFRIAEEGADAFLDELRGIFLAREAQGDAYRNEIRRTTQHGDLFESRFDVFTWRDAPVRKLTKFCHTSLTTMLAKLADYPREDLLRLQFDYHAWFHVTRTGGYQGLHNHQNASWSGIFCVDPGAEVPQRSDSGLVRFHDPRTMANMYTDAGNGHLKMPANHGAFDVRHEPGKLVIFPSYLLHEIFPYLGERPRVVVAFNCWIHMGASETGKSEPDVGSRGTPS